MSSRLSIGVLALLASLLTATAAMAAIMPNKIMIKVRGSDDLNYALERRGDEIFYAAYESSQEPKFSAIAISQDRWDAFKATMLAQKATQWPEKCINSHVTNGPQWKLLLEYDDFKVNSNGSSAFPKADGSCDNDLNQSLAYKQFLQALRDLTHEDFY